LSKTTRSEQEIDDVKKVILDEALKLLNKEGFENLSMYKLGKRTNMTAANLYNYYRNKNQLIIAIHKKTFELLYNMFVESAANEKDPVQKIKKIMTTFVSFGKNFPNYYDVMFNRRVPQLSDFTGTSEEMMSRDEYQSSIRNLHLVINIGKEVISSHPELEGIDTEFYFIKIFSELHGILSLHNSGVLKEMVDNPESIIDRIIDDLLAQYINVQ
jgi:AcrR family transcriptional regulator